MTTWPTTGKSDPDRVAALMICIQQQITPPPPCPSWPRRSVVVSLRLLPKLFGTFQQFGSSYDTHWITM